MDKMDKARAVRRVRDALDTELFIARAFGRPVNQAWVDSLTDELARLCALEPALTLADVEAVGR